MKIWVDAQLSPSIAAWINQHFSGLEAHSVRQLGLRDAEDKIIFDRARLAKAVVMTKDIDFIKLLERKDPPPHIIWITCGNTSNRQMKVVLEKTLAKATQLLQSGEPMVEISDQ
jgi:predicted nuclease of predicted toxin-antitoxin system